MPRLGILFRLHWQIKMQQKIPQLDAVRGLAILVVMLHNTSPKYPALHLERLFSNGWMGVDLFLSYQGF